MNHTTATRGTRGRVAIIRAVGERPLGFFVLVVLAVEVLVGTIAGFQECPGRIYLLVGMIVLMFFVVGIVGFLLYSGRVRDLLGIAEPFKSSRYSLLVGPPKDMPDFDVAAIDWDDSECFLVGTKLKEQITLVPTRVGPSFRVEIPQRVFDKLGPEDSLELQLKDKKGHRWRVKRFFIFENLLPLSWGEDRTVVLRSYEEGFDEQ
jgi:hypothetical protein